MSLVECRLIVVCLQITSGAGDGEVGRAEDCGEGRDVSGGGGGGGGTVSMMLDDFTCKLTADDARVLVDLLKLAVAGRSGPRAKETLAQLLVTLGKSSYPVSFTKSSSFKLSFTWLNLA